MDESFGGRVEGGQTREADIEGVGSVSEEYYGNADLTTGEVAAGRRGDLGVDGLGEAAAHQGGEANLAEGTGEYGHGGSAGIEGYGEASTETGVEVDLLAGEMSGRQTTEGEFFDGAIGSKADMGGSVDVNPFDDGEVSAENDWTVGGNIGGLEGELHTENSTEFDINEGIATEQAASAKIGDVEVGAEAGAEVGWGDDGFEANTNVGVDLGENSIDFGIGTDGVELEVEIDPAVEEWVDEASENVEVWYEETSNNVEECAEDTSQNVTNWWEDTTESVASVFTPAATVDFLERARPLQGHETALPGLQLPG